MSTNECVTKIPDTKDVWSLFPNDILHLILDHLSCQELGLLCTTLNTVAEYCKSHTLLREKVHEFTGQQVDTIDFEQVLLLAFYGELGHERICSMQYLDVLHRYTLDCNGNLYTQFTGTPRLALDSNGNLLTKKDYAPKLMATNVMSALSYKAEYLLILSRDQRLFQCTSGVLSPIDYPHPVVKIFQDEKIILVLTSTGEVYYQSMLNTTSTSKTQTSKASLSQPILCQTGIFNAYSVKGFIVFITRQQTARITSSTYFYAPITLRLKGVCVGVRVVNPTTLALVTTLGLHFVCWDTTNTRFLSYSEMVASYDKVVSLKRIGDSVCLEYSIPVGPLVCKKELQYVLVNYGF